MRVVDFSIRRPVTVFIFAMAAVVFGVVAFRQLAVDLLPDITYPSLTVQTRYGGAAPAEVESLVTKPLENGVGVVNNVVRVISSSRPDISEVTLEFQWGTDMDFASLDVRERLDVVRLPVAVERPVLLRYDPSLDPVLRLGLTGGTDLVRLRRIADEEVKRSLERVEGVAAAIVSGGLEEEIQVELDERRIGSLGLDVQTVINRLAQENVNLTGGRLREGQTEYMVRTVNELLRPEDLRQIVVQRSAGGAITKLDDVATVVKGSREREIITRIDGRESVEIAIYKEGGTNTVTVVESVREALDQVGARLEAIDPSLEISQLTDQARYIRESIDAVVQSALLGGGLAILVLFLFLRSLKNTLIIGIAIPISVMATFFLMYVAGISLNIMSLGGLTLGIGLLLDNSIVVLEAIQRKREEGLGVVESARVGASEVARAVSASTITTVCVFVPIVFVEGVAGQLFGDQALTVTFSLVVSLAVALTLIPMFASRTFSLEETPDETRETEPRGFAPLRAVQRGIFLAFVGVARAIKTIVGLCFAAGRRLGAPFLVGFDHGLQGVSAGYRRVLKVALARPVAAFLTAAAMLGVTLPLVGRLGVELVPELVQGEFFVDVELLPGTRLEVTDRRLGEISERAASLRGVAEVFTVAGASNEQGGSAGERRENIGQLTVKLRPPISRPVEEQAIDELRLAIDEANSVYARLDLPSAGPPAAGLVADRPAAELTSKQRGAMDYRFGRPSYFSFRTPVEIEIRGFNLGLLQRLAAELVARLRTVDGLVDVKSSTEGGNPELQIFFDRDRLASLGYTVGSIGNLIRAKVQGEVATDIQREDRSIDIRLRAGERYRDSVKDLRNLNVSRTGRTPIPLDSVADVVEIEGPAEIRRANGSRVALITANLEGRDLGSVSADVEAILEEMSFPAGFDWRIGGQRQEMETSFDSMRLAILLAVFMVYLVMASQFESLLHPFVILFSVPLSVIGAILALWASGTTVSIVVLIGAILLAGIVVNNAIILVDYTNNLRREGRSKVEALLAAGQVRLRPILMTTATTVLGLLPMALGLGEGSELRAPMAITVVGGLITSTVLTLVLIPAVYKVLDRGR